MELLGFRVARSFKFAKQHYDEGQKLFEQNKLPEAIDEYEACLRLDSQRINALFNMALCEVMLHRNDSALKHLLTLLRKQPDRPDIPYLIGQVMHAEGRHEEEILWYDRAIKLEPDCRQAKEALKLARHEIYAEVWK